MFALALRVANSAMTFRVRTDRAPEDDGDGVGHGYPAPPGRERFAARDSGASRPGRKPCEGRLLIVRRPDMVIEYECPACEDDGVVHGWRGTYRDITGFLDADDPGNVLCGIAPAEYEQARKVITLARGSEAIVHGAIYVNGEVVLAASPNDMALFSEEVAAAANHATNRRAEQLLDSLWDKLEAAVEDQQEIERREEVMRELASETERPGLYK